MMTKALGNRSSDLDAGSAPDCSVFSKVRNDNARRQVVNDEDSDVDEPLLDVEGLVRQANSVTQARVALAKIRDFAGHEPAQIGVRRALLVLREKVGDTDGLLQDFELFFSEYPDDRTLLEIYLRLLVNSNAKDKALVMLDSILTLAYNGVDFLTERAALLDRLKFYSESDAAFEAAIALEDSPAIRIEWAKRLAKRFYFEDAGQVLDGISKPMRGGKARVLKSHIEAQRVLFSRFLSKEDKVGKDFRILAMELAVRHYCKRELRLPPKSALKLSLLTGNLGAGGSERQLSSLARLIHSPIADRTLIHDVGFSEVEVIVKQHTQLGVSDFFLSDLKEAGIPVRQINNMQPIKAQRQTEIDPDLAHLMGMLPANVQYGLERLAPHFRSTQPDVVSLWQDGTCLFGALAALFAGVPRIQLVFRGLPPNIRVERYKPEYEFLYRALAEVPGVQFVCNSQVCAQAYADWLGMPVEHIEVLYNGVEVANLAPTAVDQRTWDAFEAATSDATETIGSVLRFEPDKAPLTWIRIAAAYARERPKARFVLVGDGRLMPDARELAKKLGIADRLLFAGISRTIRFWFGRMDVVLLTSRFEGLPNVLIEAQMSGRPVVSTPAGGASECMVQGLTGHLLDCADNPDVNQACELIRDMVDRSQRDPQRMIVETFEFSSKRFDPDIILGAFRDLCVLPIRQTVEA